MPNIIGQTLLDQFRVEAFLAAGGMGAVYRVWDIKRNVPLAMKVLHSELAEDPAVLRRFQREANALKKLAHPNIVPFYGLYQTLDIAFLMERFIDGPSLKDILKQQQGKPLSVDEALTYLKVLSAALGYAHANGVVHCDVKPGNVMVDQGGNIYLTDFGIARNAESTTTTMGAAGTPAYMSPEQIRGREVTPATDVYALGVLLFEMLTGQRPFRGNEAGTEKGGTTANERIRYGHLKLQPPDPRTFNPNLPPGLTGAILKALAKDPRDRYASTQDFFNAVSIQSGRRVGSVAERVTLPAALVQPDRSQGQERIPDGQPAITGPAPAAGRFSFWQVMGGVVIVMLVIGAILLLTNRPRPLQASPSGFPSPAAATQASYIVQGSQNPTPTSVLPQPPAATQAPAAPSTDTPGPTETPLPPPTETPLPPPTDTPVPVLVPGGNTTSPVDGMLLLYVPEGNFIMGDSAAHAESECSRVSSSDQCIPGTSISFNDEAPAHTVYLDAFYIDQTEVTDVMYTKCARAGNCVSKGTGTDKNPVVNVTWSDASTYCGWAGRRLPTEAEWEKAARGTDGHTFPWGNDAPSCSLANFAFSGTKKCAGGVAAVGSFPAGASPYGALDMAGNVWEWVADWFAPGYDSAAQRNPTGPATGTKRSMRGGSNWNPAGFMASTGRGYYNPDTPLSVIGFRCAANP